MKAQVQRTLREIEKRYAKAESEFYEIGKALTGLQKREIYRAMGVGSFMELMNEFVMPFATANRFVVIAKTYTKKTAQALGVEKGFQLARLAKADPKLRRTAEQLFVGNARLGKKRVQSMTAKEIEMLVLRLKGKTKKKVEPSRADEQAMDGLMEKWEDLLGLEAEFEIDAKAGVVRIEVPLDELR